MKIGLLVMLVGLVPLTGSNAQYYRRTKDPNRMRWWLSKALLTRSEYVANRVGFALAVTGLVLLYVLR